MTYFGTRLSENISRREPEGYLICLNVPVARTGTQDYLPSELGLSEPDSRLIPVIRPEEEVFSPACVASFEGMPVTDDHPSAPEGVTAENSRFLQKGHAHHVRRGAGAESDLLLADLIITDPVLIGEILAGKREISCGYNYVLHEEDGQFIQREIRGNHVAVVDSGRAGKRVSIKDSLERRKKIMKNKTQKKSLWQARLMARMAKDGDVEGLAEIISEMMEEPEVPAVPAVVPAAPGLPVDPLVSAVASAVAENPDPRPDGEETAPVIVETPVDQPVIVDCGPEILDLLRRIVTLLSGPASADCDPDQPAADEDPAETVTELAETVAEAVAEATETLEDGEADPDSGEDPVEALVAEILESEAGEQAGGDGEEIFSHILEPEAEKDGDPDDPDGNSRAADALRAALASFRPQLKRMTPKERRRFNADVAARLNTLSRRSAASGRPGAYAALRKSPARDQSVRSLGQKIMACRNANFRN